MNKGKESCSVNNERIFYLSTNVFSTPHYVSQENQKVDTALFFSFLEKSSPPNPGNFSLEKIALNR